MNTSTFTQFATMAGALSFVKAVVDLVKYVRARNTNGWVTQLAVWLAGVFVVVVMSFSDFAQSIDVGGVTLDTASWGTLLLVGLGLGSTAMLANDVKQAIDHTDSAAKPDLVGPPSPPDVVP